MYQHCEPDSRHITLHDCHAEKINFEKGTLSFFFPDGFWVTKHHPLNHSGSIVLTSASQADFQLIGGKLDGMEVSIFQKSPNGTAIREDWAPERFINSVNAGDFDIEFIAEYKGCQSFLFKCWIWFGKAPYHFECEIILHSETVRYCWDELRYGCVW